VDGQNDDYYGQFEVSDAAFQDYLARHRHACKGHLVPESNGDIIGSYIMIAPNGKFFDDTKGQHTYSRSILQYGVAQALGDIKYSHESFMKRGGLYDWKNPAKVVVPSASAV
jgi:radical S-adenosyl methionine domain-containing protein 2